MAEYYHIYDMTELPLITVARLVIGLRNDCRLKRKLSGLNYTLNDILMARILDSVNILVWMQTKDGRNNRNRPVSVADKMLDRNEPTNDIKKFKTSADFEKAWKSARGE